MWVPTQDLLPGRCFRLLLLGYFEGLDSERAIARRAADSLSVRSFVGLDRARSATGSFDGLAHAPADQRRNASGLHVGVAAPFGCASRQTGKTIGIDATTTTLEANAALRSSVLRDHRRARSRSS